MATAWGVKGFSWANAGVEIERARANPARYLIGRSYCQRPRTARPVIRFMPVCPTILPSRAWPGRYSFIRLKIGSGIFLMIVMMPHQNHGV